jgi:hypothetical protein
MLHELSALARRCCGLVIPLTTTLLVACGVQRCGDDADIVNNIPYFLLHLLQRTHDAQRHLYIRKPMSNTFVLLRPRRAFFGRWYEGIFRTDDRAFVSGS